MEQTKPLSKWIGAFLGLVVSADVLLTIFKHWKGYDALSRCNAVVLMLFLVVPPGMALRGESTETSKYGRAQMVIWGYMSVMLATILFGMR